MARNTDAVWVDVIPSMVSFGSDLAKEAAGAGTRAGQQVAVELERVATQAGQQAGRALGSGIAAAQAKVDQLGAALASARNKEADAAGKVRIAEEKLNEVRALGEKASGSQKAAAEERLAAARRAAATATDNATRATKALEKAQKDADEATDDVVESTTAGGHGMGEYAGQLAGAAKAAAGFAVAAVGVSGGIDLISQALAGTDVQATLAAQLGATPQMAAEFGQIAGRLYANNYGESLQNVAEGLRAVHQSGALAEDATSAQIEDITGKALNLQKVFGVDITKAMRSVGVLLRTDMAPNAEVAIDIVTRGFQQGVNVADDFLDTLSEYSTQFRKLGLDGATATAILSQGLKAGARDSDVVADALKEFSIRAIDGSAATSAAYKTLGLDANATAQQIARGGTDASAGLQTVLDRLRGIEDPVMQAQAAVGLFGTKAEDLGAALYALDPAAAVGGLGEVAGAAQRMGETIAASPQATLEQFIRQSKTWAVDVLGGQVVPVLVDFIGWITGSLVPALSDAGQWIQRNKEWLIPLGIVLGTFAVTYKAIAIATDLWAKRTMIATAAQWALNTAMSANPVGLIIAAIVAAVGAFIYFWNTSEGFRNFWIKTWEIIKQIAVATWEVYLRPAFNAIVTAIKWIGDAAVWLWQNALQPAFSFIDGAVRILAAVILTLFILPGVAAFKLLAAAGLWLWQNALQPAFEGIGAVATWLWQTIISPFIELNVAAFQLLASIGLWLWQHGIQPAFEGIGAIATWLWQTIIKPFIDLNVAAFQLLTSAAIWLWQQGIQPAFEGIGTILRWVYDHTIAKVFDGMRAGVDGVGWAFNQAVDWIGRIWDGLKSKLAGPVNFVVNAVYNDGIRAVWNKVAGFVGVGELPYANPITFAGGGFVVPGYAPGRDVFPSLLSPGESVLVPELTAAIGPRNIMAANYAASGRRGTVAGGGGVAKFAGGGVVGDLLSWVPGIGDELAALWRDPRAWVAARIGGASRFADLLGAIPEKLIGSAVSWLSDKLGGLFGGGGDLGKWIAAAIQLTGVDASWARPLETLIMRESGGNPAARNDWDINAQRGQPSQGLMQTIPSTFAAYRDPRLPNNILDPIANIVAGINYIKSRYGSIFNVQQANPSAAPLGYDTGGWLPPGEHSVFNGTRQPEAILTGDQWASLSAVVEDRRGGVNVVQHIDARGADADSVITTSENRLLHALRR